MTPRTDNPSADYGDDTSAQGCPILTTEPGVICDACDCYKRHETARAPENPTPPVEGVRNALEPFAKAAERYDDPSGVSYTNDNVELWQNGKRVDYITVGDLRRARQALAALSRGEPRDAFQDWLDGEEPGDQGARAVLGSDGNLIRDLEAANMRLVEACEAGASWFREYAAHHAAKPDLEKAERNEARAEFLEKYITLFSLDALTANSGTARHQDTSPIDQERRDEDSARAVPELSEELLIAMANASRAARHATYQTLPTPPDQYDFDRSEIAGVQAALALLPQPPAPRTAREPTPPASSGGVGRDEIANARRDFDRIRSHQDEGQAAADWANEHGPKLLALLSQRPAPGDQSPGVGVLQEALERAFQECRGLIAMPSTAAVNLLGRSVVRHIPEVEAEFAARAVPQQSEGE